MQLESIAPRLAKARDQQVAFLRAKYIRCKVLENEVDRTERLVTHRDLQYYRALATNDGRYIDRRQKKLEAGKARLRKAKKKLRLAQEKT